MPEKSNLIEAIQLKLNDFLSLSDEARNSIKAVYVFGSALHGENFRDASDIDMAFLVDHTRYKKDPFSASASAYMAATEIGLMLNRQTDVIILNSASYETAYQAVTTGKNIYEADHEARIEYEIALKGLYYDFKPFLENLRKQSRLRLGDKGPG